MKKNIFFLSALIGALSIVQGARGMEIELDRLLTLNGTPITQIYTDITDSGAFKINESAYTGHMMSEQPAKGSLCEAMLVKIQGDDGVAGVVVKKNIRPGAKSAAPVKYEFCEMQAFHGIEKGPTITSSAINAFEIKDGSMFHLKSESVDGGYTTCVKIVHGNNSYSMKTKIFGITAVIGITAAIVWWLFPDFFSKLITRA